ncbi:hypothetical protein GIB67_011120 [Kingdonia uniflora]|uniref:Uncharacterized protein n=1 Tax=Kingdonia uniflora TaxID=39325 RepID=A0A7J7PA67_9MAGN|nr:hypothetical protein GIB67_011120 [Kingdonia uniflora]
MASGSPRSRIDQFYAAKKRKPVSPGLKSGKISKDRGTVLAGLPSPKGTLDSFIVSSQDDSVRVSGGSAKKSKIKRNLGLEINLSSQVVQKQDISSTKDGVRSVEGVARDCSSGVGGDIGVEADVEDTMAAAPVNENPELKQFASNFLSLYCNELSSTVSSLSEPKLYGHKRSGSPTLLVAEGKASKKKHLVPDLDHPQIEVGMASFNQVSHSHFIVGTTANGTSKSHMVLRKCSNGSESSVDIVECYTPNILTNKPSTRTTSTSVRGVSIFSPGEEFWDEAILVADGLHGPLDKFSVQNADEVKIIKSQVICNLEKGKGVDRLDARLELKVPVVTVSNNEVSPLAVRHFDFLHEDKNLHEKVLRNCSFDNTEDSGSINHKPLLSITRCGKAETSLQYMRERGHQSSLSISSNNDPNITCSDKGEIREEQKTVFISVEAERKAGSCTGENESNTSTEQEKTSRSLFLNQKKSDESGTPSSSLALKNHLEISNWLPSEICNIYMKKGISKLYPWQVI